MGRLFLAILLFCSQTFGVARADGYPDRSIALVVPFAAGGATDAIARALAERMGHALGKQVIVENRPGAGGALGAVAVSKAAPDGYTLLMSTTSTHVILPLTQVGISYDPVKSFAPIGMVASAPNLLVVSPKVPANSVAELIAYAKDNPGKINFASSGQGTITHLIGEMFVMDTAITAQHIPYKSGVQSFAELTTGQIHFLFDSIVWSLPQIRAGQLKGLAITSARRSSLAPDIPTVAESGIANFEGITWFGLSAPAGTPDNVLLKLRQQLSAVLSDREFVERLAILGAEPLNAQGEEFTAVVVSDMRKWAEVVKRAGIGQ
jgi:tripartite-type tricarboxylate transporter receptor subunit TctC